MTLELLFKDKNIKAKEKTERISKWLLDGSLPADELMAFAEKSKDPDKATCIEAMEYASRQFPELADENVFYFVTKTLADKAPRVKWESAKVIGNIAHLFPSKLEKAIDHLLKNTKHEGTVVRWATAFALGEILKLKTSYHKELLPAIEEACRRELNKGVKEKYLEAIKKIKNSKV